MLISEFIQIVLVLRSRTFAETVIITSVACCLHARGFEGFVRIALLSNYS